MSEAATAELITHSPSEMVKASLGKLITDSKIAELREQFMPLKVADINDSKGVKKCHDARMVVRGLRLSVEKVHKEGKADALAACRLWDEEKRRILAELDPIEEHLQTQEDWVKNEKARLAKEKYDARVAALQAVGATAVESAVETMSDKVFDEFLAGKKAEHELRLKREAEERAEQERLAEAQRKAQERLGARMNRLSAAEVFLPMPVVQEADDADFEEKLNEAVQKLKEKRDREAAEAETRRLEQEKLDRQKAELEAQRKEQEAKVEEVRRLQEKKEAEQRAEFERQQREEADRRAAEQAEIDRKNREAQELIDKQRAALLQKRAAMRQERASSLGLNIPQSIVFSSDDEIFESVVAGAVKTREEQQEREAAEAQRQAEEAEAARQRSEALKPFRKRIFEYGERIDDVALPELPEDGTWDLVLRDLKAKRNEFVKWINDFADNV